MDDKGVPVFSNIRPVDSSKVKNFQVATQEVKPTPISAAAIAQQAAAQAEALRREQALQERVAKLKRQLQAEQNQAAMPPVPDPYGTPFPVFGYPLGYPAHPSIGYGFSYAVPSLMPRRILSPGRIVFPGRIVNSGPVFATRAPPTFGTPRFASSGIPAAGMGRR